MTIRSVVVCFIVPIFITCCGHTNKQFTLKSTTGGLPESQREAAKELLGYDVVRNYPIEKWTCFVPDDQPDLMLNCVHESGISMQAFGQGPSEIAVPTRANGTTFVWLKDIDGDGRFDSLEYDVADEKGKLLRSVKDEDMNGVLDREIDFRTKTIRLRLDGEWVKLQKGKRDDSGKIIYTIDADGTKKRVYFSSYPYKLEDYNLDTQ